jgi:hypothetical protein
MGMNPLDIRTPLDLDFSLEKSAKVIESEQSQKEAT